MHTDLLCLDLPCFSRESVLDFSACDVVVLASDLALVGQVQHLQQEPHARSNVRVLTGIRCTQHAKCKLLVMKSMQNMTRKISHLCVVQDSSAILCCCQRDIQVHASVVLHNEKRKRSAKMSHVEELLVLFFA